MSPPAKPDVPFLVNPSAGTPIYQQLIDQVTRMVASGHLSAQQALPSVRDVAVALAINPMTVSKAYNLLEGQGVLERRRGVGMIVAEGEAGLQTKADRLALLKPTLERAAAEAAQLQIDRNAALSLFEKLLKGNP